jgi:hypothetical protein
MFKRKITAELEKWKNNELAKKIFDGDFIVDRLTLDRYHIIKGALHG